MLDALGPVATTVFIFGGCCSNVFALEAIVKYVHSSETEDLDKRQDTHLYRNTLLIVTTGVSPAVADRWAPGLLITFFQWVFTSAFAYLTQLSPKAAYTVERPKVPLWRWAFIAAQFYAINMLNNWAFAYNISVPVHIILRSFGSVTTMLAGYLRGKHYSALQVWSVVLLTAGVLVSAWADSASKGKSMSVENSTSTSEFTQGLLLLLIAQSLAAYMGAYVEDTYAAYTASWTENLFYSHFLSLPLFLPLAQTLRSQYARLAATPPLPASTIAALAQPFGTNTPPQLASALQQFTATFKALGLTQLPQGVLFLLVNAITQLACISGVNLLSARSSAVTVTIVLNIRKLVSFIFSTLLFGHTLNASMLLGSVLVFGSGALYGWETSWRLPRARKAAAMNGEKGKKSR